MPVFQGGCGAWRSELFPCSDPSGPCLPARTAQGRETPPHPFLSPRVWGGKGSPTGRQSLCAAELLGMSQRPASLKGDTPGGDLRCPLAPGTWGLQQSLRAGGLEEDSVCATG